MRTITLTTLPDTTAQEVFDYVTARLLEQGKQSKNFGGACRYRTVCDDGTVLKCAAGWLIGDDEYEQEMDDGGASTDWMSLVEQGFFPDTHQSLISKLQNVHDNYAPDYWLDEFKKIAKKFNLQYGNEEACEA